MWVGLAQSVEGPLRKKEFSLQAALGTETATSTLSWVDTAALQSSGLPTSPYDCASRFLKIQL